jgi:hypothetical protein
MLCLLLEDNVVATVNGLLSWIMVRIWIPRIYFPKLVAGIQNHVKHASSVSVYLVMLKRCSLCCLFGIEVKRLFASCAQPPLSL